MTSDNRPPSAIFKEGMTARSNGRPASSCTYVDGSDAWHEWLEGWQERDALSEADAPYVERFRPREA